MSLQVGSLEARLCGLETGSRGHFLFSLGTLQYSQSSKLPSDLQPRQMGPDDAPSVARRQQHDLLALFGIQMPDKPRRLSPRGTPSATPPPDMPPRLSDSPDPEDAEIAPDLPPLDLGMEEEEEAARERRVRESIESDAAIQAHLHEPYLHSVVVDSFRLVLTRFNRDALLGLVEAYFTLVTTSLPGTLHPYMIYRYAVRGW